MPSIRPSRRLVMNRPMTGPSVRVYGYSRMLSATSAGLCSGMVAIRTRSYSGRNRGYAPVMASLGFWSLAEEDPAHLALVDPDGTEITAGELLASSNQLVHGLR